MGGDDPEADGRFAAALEDAGDRPHDADLAREIALARRLGALGPALDPDPQARERARRWLLEALSREIAD